MILKNNIIGKRILLRSARESDAAFILKLRLDPGLNRFLHKTDPSLAKQNTWIAERKKVSDDYHMIIESLGGTRLGVVAIYEIDWDKKTFTWGRWIISKNAPIYTAGESMALVYHLAFNILKLKLALIPVNRDNKRMVAFHKVYGARESAKDRECVHLRFSRKDFDKWTNCSL